MARHQSLILPEINDLIQLIEEWKKQGQTIVFTNGCFDIIHSGHISYLEEASKEGNKLVVAINSDESVKRIKGVSRPINREMDRARVLSAIGVVDAVTIFSEDTPYALIQEVRPNVLVKGGDWKIEEIVGSDIVLNDGGQVKSLGFLSGYSTTKIASKIKQSEP